ncbi:MAG: phage tail protein [Ruminococcus flavefaciens]|nr:phage tail protein [Ruminococcus flavefaciens]
MLKIFGKTDKNFLSNGDIVLQPLKARVKKADNGDFYLDLETGLEYADYMAEGNIVVANTPQGDQPFRISDPKKTRSKITTRAYHAFYDSKNYLIADSYVVDKDCGGALEHLNSATDTPSPFTTLSDITTISSYRCVRKSLYEAIQTVLERWGGHLVRDGFTIAIRSAIGKDNGVTVRYRKNLKDITCEESWESVVTKLMPVGKDGILLNDQDDTADIYVYSGNEYPLPYTKTVSFSQDNISEEDFTDSFGNTDTAAYRRALVEDLRAQAQDYVDKNSVPQVNYTLKANVEKLTDIGDIIEVIDERLGIKLLTNVISYDYDCILEEYRELEFGNFKKTLSGLMGSVTAAAEAAANKSSETVKVILGQELINATEKIWGALGSSHVIYDGDKILVVDSLPKETAHNCMMINSGGIGFSTTGTDGIFNSAWTIDGTLDMQQINVINLAADLIKGGILKLGSRQNESGILELYDAANNLIGKMDKDGLKMFGTDGGYVLMNSDVGFAGYDRTGRKIYWVSQDEFHMKKSVVEEEITLCNQLRFIPIQISEDGIIINEGIGLVSSATGGA